MSKEYIGLEAAKERLRMWITDCLLDGDNEAAGYFRDCIDLLDSLPTVDVVSTGRCQNCVYARPIQKLKYQHACPHLKENGHSCD